MKKRLLALLLVASMMMGMSLTAFAAPNTEVAPDADVTNVDVDTVTFTKLYRMENADGISPKETFGFTALKCTDVVDGGVIKEDGTTVDEVTAPLPTIGSVDYNRGEATYKEGLAKKVTIKLPEYKAVGVYTYEFYEVPNNVAGVVYHADKIILKVTVIQGEDGLVRVAAIHTEGPAEVKADEIENVYFAGALVVNKKVTGLFGDKNKEFTFKVEFTAPTYTVVDGDAEAAAYKPVNDSIKYNENGGMAIEPSDWVDGKAVAEFTLKDGEHVRFTNIPYGVSYTVKEADYSADTDDNRYRTTYDSNASGNISSPEVTTTVTNHKDGNIDTGIFTNNMPYILALVAIAAVAVVMFRRKREF